MKQLIHVALILSAWAARVNSVPNEQLDSVKDACNLLNSFFVDSEMLTQFNGIFFNDFKTGKDFRSQGPLSIGGSFIADNAFLNQRNQLACSSESSQHGLILKGATNSSITVNGLARIQVENSNIRTPLDKCSVTTTDTRYDFDLAKSNAIAMSHHLADMLPNWSIDRMGIIVKLIAEGISVKQPYNVFTMPAKCGAGPYQAKNYFACKENKECETPAQTLSDGHAMFLGRTSRWTGPVEQIYPNDNLVIFNERNVPVMEGEIFDIQTKNPSVGLNACNTIYNFYAVNRNGKFEANGKFSIKRSSENSLNGMILAPQAHIIDNATGSFAGQVIADSYESTDDGVQIFDYQSVGGEQCQVFAGCVTKKDITLVRRQAGDADVASNPVATDPTRPGVPASRNSLISSSTVDPVASNQPRYKAKHQSNNGKKHNEFKKYHQEIEGKESINNSQ
ncbi:hypothetical protein MFLAVUS_009503 [Mucor flavus]|uniref:Choice-of-anchor A domain-containing protein n=1 Tax=Mucor flavus TaxID=439312 RepID=A0ABP9ZAA3_9FUNG